MPRATPVERDRKLLKFVAAHIKKHGYAPTYREMARHLHVGLQTIVDTLARLRAAGDVTWEEGRTRTLQIKETATP